MAGGGRGWGWGGGLRWSKPGKTSRCKKKPPTKQTKSPNKNKKPQPNNNKKDKNKNKHPTNHVKTLPIAMHKKHANKHANNRTHKTNKQRGGGE